MANGQYTPISPQERAAYLQFLSGNPSSRKIKDEDLFGTDYSSQYEPVNIDDLYAEYALICLTMVLTMVQILQKDTLLVL